MTWLTSADGSGTIFAADSWTALPAHVAPWRLESTRAALQIYLRQLSLQRDDEMDTSAAPSTPGRQLFIERLMLDSDASVADDLIGSFDAQGAEQARRASSRSAHECSYAPSPCHA